MILTYAVACIVGLLIHTGEIPVAPAPRAKVFTSHLSTYYGEVMAVDSLSITIRGQEDILPMEQVIRTFKAGTSLRKGEQDPREVSSADYRLSDVKVGDIVLVMLHPRGDDDEFVTVRIRRRPGGTVPKAPFEASDTRNPYHEMMNAYQAFEEKGIPLPPKYDPRIERVGDAADRAQMIRVREHLRKVDLGLIAPPPRPVVRK